MGLKANHK